MWPDRAVADITRAAERGRDLDSAATPSSLSGQLGAGQSAQPRREGAGHAVGLTQRQRVGARSRERSGLGERGERSDAEEGLVRRAVG